MKVNIFDDKKLISTWRTAKNKQKNGDYKMFSGWVHSYETFKEWALENGYDNNKRIVRVNKDKDYCPSNCEVKSIKNVKNNSLYKIWRARLDRDKLGKEWCNDFEAFERWALKNGYDKTKKHRITAINKKEKLCPENCVVADSLQTTKYRRLYSTWYGMKERCNNPEHDRYHYYGKRGIMVCKEWNDSFEVFREWALNNGYKSGLSIERVNVNGNYEPANCEWIPMSEQYKNRRNTVKVSYKGKKYLISELSKLTGVKENLIYSRHQEGCTDDELLQHKSSYIEFRGGNYTPKQLADKLGINVDTLRDRYHRYGYRGEKLAKEIQRKNQASVEINGEKKTLKQLEKETGIGYNTLKQRYDIGYRDEKILNITKRNKRVIIHNGKEMSLKEFSEITNLNYHSTCTKYNRLTNDGIEVITGDMFIFKTREAVLYEINGESKTVKEWSELAGISQKSFRDRYKKGMRGEDLISPPQNGNQYTKQKNNDNDSEQLGLPL